MRNIIIFIFLLVGFHSQAQWQTMTSPTNRQLWSVYFVNESYGFTVGDTGTILKTTNGGTTWTVQSNVTNNSLYSVFFLTNDTGFVVGHNRILRTTNGGTNWTEQYNGSGFVAYSVYFPSHSTGYVVGTNGFVIKTIDNGTTWNTLYTGYGRDFFSIHFPTIDTGYIVGACTPAQGGQQTLLKTTDGGINWFSVNDTSTHWTTFYSIFFNDVEEGYAVGEYSNEGVIFKTINGGGSWSHQYIPEIPYLRSVYFTSPEVSYIVGSNDQIWKTHNGMDWVNQFEGYWIGSLNSVYFVNDTVGYAVGMGGLIMKTTNGGAVGINDESSIFTKGFVIAPNPVENAITVSCRRQCNGEIVEMDGKIVKIFKINKSEQEIDVSELPSGLYIIRLNQEKGISFSKKFFIAH